MRGFLFLLVASLGLLLATALAVAARRGITATGRVYTVREMRIALQEHPVALLGPSVCVRGVAWPCLGWAYGRCLAQGMVVAGEPADYLSPSLVDADASAVDPLPFAWAGPDPLRAFLRRLPWLGSLAPRAQAIRWGEVAVYRVQLRVQGRAYGGAGGCYEAVLLDAAPSAL